MSAKLKSETESVVDELVAVSREGTGHFDWYPIEPNTLQLRIGRSNVADNGNGDLLCKGEPIGAVNYATGSLRLPVQIARWRSLVYASYRYTDTVVVVKPKLSPFRAKVLEKIKTYHAHPLSFWVAQELRASEWKVSKAMNWLDENGYITADNRPVEDKPVVKGFPPFGDGGD